MRRVPLERLSAGDRRLAVVVFIRRRSELVVSKWKSEAKRRARPPLDSMIERSLQPGNQLPRYGRTLEIYAKVVGASSIRLVQYDEMRRVGADTEGALFEAAGVERPAALDHVSGSGPVNESSDEHEAELIRLVHLVREAQGRRGPWPSLLEPLRALLADGNGVATEALARVRDGVDRTTTLRHVDEHYRPEDEELLALYGDLMTHRPKGDLFPIEGHEYPVIAVHRPDLLEAPAVRSLVERLDREIRAVTGSRRR